MYGMDSNAAGDYNTLTQRALSAALAKRAATGSGGSRGYYRQSSEWSKSELRNLMKDRESVAAKGGDTTWYDGILADAGYPVPETKNTESTGGQSSDTGTLLAQRYAKRGYSAWAIANIMSQNGYSDKEISDALEKAGVE